MLSFKFFILFAGVKQNDVRVSSKLDPTEWMKFVRQSVVTCVKKARAYGE